MNEHSVNSVRLNRSVQSQQNSTNCTDRYDSGMSETGKSRFSRPPAPERVLEIASELFYGEGINTVGVDRIAAEADASKATLYAHYGSKDGLVAAYLDRRAAFSRERLTAHLESQGDARDKLLAVFESLVDWYSQDDFRGCHFIHAGSELTDPDHPAVIVTRRHRHWVKNLFTELSEALGESQPHVLAAQLLMLYDGATIAADLDRYPEAARAARQAVERLIRPVD
jgi:AcrR family transcriptional regulator